MTCDMKENYQEAYKHYLATTNFISGELVKRSSNVVWCDDKTEKLLNLALKCIDAAKHLNGKRLEESAAPPELPTIPSSIPQIPAELTSDLPQALSQAGTTEPPTSAAEGDGAPDLLSILDSLPDVPANKPGKKYQAPIKRSATLPAIRKSPSQDDVTGPASSSNIPGQPSSPGRQPSQTLPRNFLNKHLPPTFNTATYIPQQPSHNQSSYFSSPLGTNLGGTMNSPVVLKVSPMEQARQKNALLAAHYERRAAQGRVNARWRLDLARAQEENLNIARELEKTLAKKSEQRKLRLEQEKLEQEGQDDGNGEGTVGIYEAILYHKRDHIVKFMISVKEHDVQNRTPSESVTELPASMSKMESTLAWCFDVKSHPISTAVGNAQFNFYNRIVPLNKKIYMASTKAEKESLYPGIEAEVEAITGDMSEFVLNLTTILYNLYPMFNCEEGVRLLQIKLSDTFYNPFLAPLLETFSFLKEDEIIVFKKYITKHGQDDIRTFPDIKQRYYLGDAPYQAAIDSLLSIPETYSPVTKFKLLTSFLETICSCVKLFYLQSGKSEEEANEIGCLGADDMMPISIYIITRAATPELISELQFLYDATHEDDLNGQEGYCLATVQSSFANIISRERECQTSNSGQ